LQIRWPADTCKVHALCLNKQTHRPSSGLSVTLSH
jgi:hypothetical protein